MRHRAGAAAALVAAALVATPVGATVNDLAPAERLRRVLEMPAHELLMRSIERADADAFETDGCSGGLSGVWRRMSDLLPGFAESYPDRPPWEGCCEMHDRVYHRAGGATSAADSFSARLAADVALRQCVVDVGAERAVEQASDGVSVARTLGAYIAVADAMYDAVRAGGVPCTAWPWRWGYGFPPCLAGGR